MEHETFETRAGEAASYARRRVHDLVDDVKEKAGRLKAKSFEELWGDMAGVVRENPGKTILISLAVGVVIGSLLRRRGD